MHVHVHAHVHISWQGSFESEAQRQEHLWCALGGEALAPSLRSGAIKLLHAEWLVHPAHPPLHTLPRAQPFPGDNPSRRLSPASRCTRLPSLPWRNLVPCDHPCR